GLGRIVLLPLNVAEMPAGTTSQCQKLWRPILEGILSIPGGNSNQTKGSDGTMESNVNRDEAAREESNASMATADFLGDVPGAGRDGRECLELAFPARGHGWRGPARDLRGSGSAAG